MEAAVRGYYVELTRAAHTNDTTQLKSLVRRTCPCYGSAESIDETAASGKSIPDAKWTVTKVRVSDIVKGSAAAEVTYAVGAYDVLDSTGKVVERVPAEPGHVELLLRTFGSAWILTNVVNLKG